MTQSTLDAALEYAARGWPVFPVRFNRDPNANKYPLTPHGMNDATRDNAVIREWGKHWPNAVWSILTGEPSEVIALDIDIRSDGNGFDGLEELGVYDHPAEAPTAHTPRGGCAVLFKWPGHFVKTCAGELAPHVDIRGDRGSVILPPGPGRFWDPHLGKDTPLPDMPEWMVIAEPEPIAPTLPPTKRQPLSRYAEAALDGAIVAICKAPDGQQRDTLNREVYSIARLVAGAVMPADLALRALLGAAQRMQSFNPSRPWRATELDKMVRLAFADGLTQPRRPERAA